MKTFILFLILLLPLTVSSQMLHPNQVVVFQQGTNSLGNPVDPLRSDPSKALGAPQNSDFENGIINFVSLGFGGSIDLALPEAVAVTPRSVISVFETTWSYSCAQYPERAQFYLSSNGFDFYLLGETCGNDGTVFYPYGVIDTVRYIRIVDVSDPADFVGFSQPADAYDVDGVSIFEISPLAITLGEFRVAFMYGGLDVYFETLSESNSRKMTLQASPDGFRWRNLIDFQAAGYSNSRKVYQAKVAFIPSSDITYFRIMETDGNGELKTYEIIAVSTPVQLSPNGTYYDLSGRRVSNGMFLIRSK
jgi:hypothetical protein